ncbi:MAG: hypothetical protein NT040_18245 [Bacteroidetes bacterium]|nr:hypothetical protein [Bacteroidota bacterium]
MNKITRLLIILFFCIAPFFSIAQQPEPPAPPPCPSNTNNKVGGSGPAGAPLEDGVWLTLGLAFCYGAYGFIKSQKRTKAFAAEDNNK